MYIFSKDSEDNETTECYWRKNQALHDWFNILARNKGLEFESFNCIEVPLTAEDIEKCLEECEEYIMDYYDGDDEDMAYGRYQVESTKKQLTELLFKVRTGLTCFYDSWW